MRPRPSCILAVDIGEEMSDGEAMIEEAYVQAARDIAEVRIRPTLLAMTLSVQKLRSLISISLETSYVRRSLTCPKLQIN